MKLFQLGGKMLFIGDLRVIITLPLMIWSLLIVSSLCTKDCGDIETKYQRRTVEGTGTLNDRDKHEIVDVVLKLIPTQHVQREASQYDFRWVFRNETNWTIILKHSTSVTIYNLTQQQIGNYRIECRKGKQEYYADVVVNSPEPMILHPPGMSDVMPKAPPTSRENTTLIVMVTVCPVLIITVGMILAINIKKRHSSIGKRSIDKSDTNNPSRFDTEETILDIYAVSHYEEISDLVLHSLEEIPLMVSCNAGLGSTNNGHLKEEIGYDSPATAGKRNQTLSKFGDDINFNSTYTKPHQRHDRSVLSIISGSGYASVKPKGQRRKSCPGGQVTNTACRFVESFRAWNECATVLPRAFRKHSQPEIMYIDIDHSESEGDIINHYDTVINMPLDPPCMYSTIDFDKKAFVAPLRRAPSSWYKRQQNRTVN